jgi:uncharacterized protein (TIGR00730 family)
MKVSVFGGSNPKPGSTTYQEAYEMGKLLGGAGLTVLTGGYGGTMEATSRGASEAGGHVIGVTCDEIESYRPLGPNQWVDEEWRRVTLQSRVDALVENCDAAIALPGGVGTLLEICSTWNRLVINSISPKPMILLGSGWQKTMETFFATLGDYVAMENREYIAFAPDPKAAIEIINGFLGLS